MRGKTIGIMMILVLLSQSLVVSYGAIDDRPVPDNEITVILKLKSSTEARRDEFLYLLEEELPHEIMLNLQITLQTMQEAEQLFNIDPRGAASSYLQALKGFRITWEMYVDYKPEAPVQSFSEPPVEDPPEVDREDQTEEITETKAVLLERFTEKVSIKIVSFQEDVDDVSDEITEETSFTLSNVLIEMHDKLVIIGDMIKTGSMESAIVALGEASLEVENDIPDFIDQEVAS